VATMIGADGVGNGGLSKTRLRKCVQVASVRFPPKWAMINPELLLTIR
jgi:hypothetical protein